MLLACGGWHSLEVLAAPSTNAAADLSGPPPAPKPQRVKRNDLPAAFNKLEPGSIADLKAMERHVKSLVARVSPAVVAVEVGFGSGSGVIISREGLVLTAGHVSGRPNRDVKFTFPDGKITRGKTLGVNRDSDTGLMKISDPGPWPFVPIGELLDTQPGDWVLALGHPGGFDAKRSLVVRLGRIIRMEEGIVQTDCTISPGDSGGPLFDMYGRVIGVHSAISTSLAENFHVPITEFSDGWQPLVQVGNWAPPPRVYVGLTVTDHDDGGCRVSVVESGSPAARAGLKAGDLILNVDGRQILAPASFRRWVAESSPGEPLLLEVRRGEKTLSLKVIPAKPARNN